MGGMTPKGVRYGGRGKGTPNKKTAVSTAGAAIKRAEDARNGRIASTRTYKAWEKAIEVVEDVYAEYQLMRETDAKQSTQTALSRQELHSCQKRLMSAIKTVLPYEKPKLQVVKLQGDRNAPLFDLSSLSDKELQFLRRTVLKAQEVPEEEEK